uniref:DC_STAMP domain-containing protein n=1 Tax=Schistosoma mansoni TaxID=6183 RepID=A0A5K4FCF2_SCHMA
MATLPSCMYWTFTNSGLLIQDWLLKPVRPINLNDAINQYYLSSIIDTKNQLSNTIKKLNENTTTTNHHHNDSIQQIIQIMFYFSLPLLPAITMLLSMINIFIEFKYYIYSKYLLYIRPYIYRLSHYFIVFYILTCINSFIIWLIILPRYIPMSIGYYNIITNEFHWNDTSIYMNISSSSSSSSNNHTPKYLTQLPAILTMQIVLRLTLCWLIIGLLTNRIYILNELYINPLKKSFGYYINYLYTMVKENLYDDHCYNNNTTTTNNNNSNNGTLLNDRSNTNKQYNHPLNSIFQCLFKFGANLCSIKKCPIKSCPICKQLNYNWSVEYLCFKCKPNYYHNNTNLLNHQIIQKNQKNNPIYLSSIINMKKINYKTIGYLILIISLLITCLLLICLPQIWSYQLIGMNLKIKLFNQYTTTTNTEHMSSISSSNHEKYYPAWRLLNKTGQTIYEYCFAVIHFVIPCCTMIVTVLLLIIRLIKIKYELKSIILHNINMNKKDIKLYMNIIQYCIIYLIQDSVLILMMGIIQLCCTIPYLMINSIHRLECLLINNQSRNGFMPTSPVAVGATVAAGATAAAAVTSKDDLIWPTRQNWLFIEMNYLFGDFLIQLIILSINLCDTNHLLIRNYSIENFQKIYLSNINRNKQNYHRIQCQMNDVMKFQEMENHQDAQQRDNDDDDNDGSDDDGGEDDHHHHDIDEDDDDDNNNLHDDMNIENGVRKKFYTYRMKTPTDSGQTSKNISPLPISHTISDVLLSPKFRTKQTIYRLNQQNRIHRSIPSTLPSPLLQRIPEMINYDTSHHHNYHHQQQQQRNNNCNSFTTKYPTNSYVEPKTNMASLTYSPRSRHPCRLQNKILLHDSSKTINNNNNSTSIHMSNPSSLIQSTKLITTPNMNLTRIQQNRQIRNNSPPPLPPPPKHLIQMLGGDSSIYSTPHGSPQQVNTHKLMILNNSNSNTPNNNISVDYSPDLLHVSSISKHESSTTGSFRQTDSGVTNMGGSLIDSEQYEPNTIVT